MLRKLNFTERVKVPRSSIRLTLRREADGVRSFDPVLSTDGIAAPENARVYIEAYHRTSFMRFDCGTVAALSIPADRRLTEIDSSSVRFRLMIVDDASHRIVAIADDIRISEKTTEGESGVAPLLPVQFSETLDQQAWRIEFDADTPVLELNNRIDGIVRLAKEDSLFFALVYPAAVRAILTRILLVDGHDAYEQTNDWWNLWMRWASHFTTTPLPSDRDDAEQWIEEVVGAFCSQHRVAERIVQSREPS